MTETITREQARTMLPELVDQSDFKGVVTVTDNDKPILVIVSPDEYDNLVAFRRRALRRSTLLAEWEKTSGLPEWNEAFESFEQFSQRMEGLSEEEIDQLLDEAVEAARTPTNA